MKRREFLKLPVLAAAAALSRELRAQDGVREIRIGYQKNGLLLIAKQQGTLASALGRTLMMMRDGSSPKKSAAASMGFLGSGRSIRAPTSSVR